MPDEYIQFEYNYKPGCCCFSSKTTIVTNMRLITRVSKPPGICSKQTSIGKETEKMIFLTDVNSIKQLESAIPSSQNTWWMKCFRILTCTCSEPEIDWLESCRGLDHLAETTERTQKSILTERF